MNVKLEGEEEELHKKPKKETFFYFKAGQTIEN